MCARAYERIQSHDCCVFQYSDAIPMVNDSYVTTNNEQTKYRNRSAASLSGPEGLNGQVKFQIELFHKRCATMFVLRRNEMSIVIVTTALLW